ncbi:MAG: MFS transporter [Eubacteriales bacterium]
MRPVNIQKKERLNFILFLSGRSISVLMSSIYTFAMGLYVLKMTGSGLSFAITLSLQIVPTVLIGPFAGILADKFNKKVMVVLTNSFNGVLFIVIFFISINGLTIRVIYIATLLISISQSLYGVCIDSAVPNIVSENKIMVLNSIGKIVDSGATIISPSLGGILYVTIDIQFFILLNGIAYIISTITEGMINFRLYYKPISQNFKFDLRRDFIEGIQYIKKTDWIKSTLLNFLIINFFIALCYSVPIPYILNNILHLSTKAYGVIQCFTPIGMIVGALFIKKITGIISYEKLMVISGIFYSVCLFLFGIPLIINIHFVLYLIIPYYALLSAYSGMIISLIDIPFINNFQIRIPENIRGRSLSISISAVRILTPMGYILSGSIVEIVPAFYLPLFGGGVLFLFYLVMYKRLTNLLFR